MQPFGASTLATMSYIFYITIVDSKSEVAILKAILEMNNLLADCNIKWVNRTGDQHYVEFKDLGG